MSSIDPRSHSSKRARSPPANTTSLPSADAPIASSSSSSGGPHKIKKIRLSMGSTAAEADTSTHSTSSTANTSSSSRQPPSLVDSVNSNASSGGIPSPAASDSFIQADESSIVGEHGQDMEVEVEIEVPVNTSRGTKAEGAIKLGPPSSLLAQHHQTQSTSSSASRASPSISRNPSQSQPKRLSLVGFPAPSSPGPNQQQHLPLPLLSHIFTSLLVPRKRTRLPSIVPLPNFLLSLSLLRGVLSTPSSSLSPKEEVELRVLEGWVGLETAKVLLGTENEREGREGGGKEWGERGKKELKETETGINKGVSERCRVLSFRFDAFTREVSS